MRFELEQWEEETEQKAREQVQQQPALQAAESSTFRSFQASIAEPTQSTEQFLANANPTQNVTPAQQQVPQSRHRAQHAARMQEHRAQHQAQMAQFEVRQQLDIARFNESFARQLGMNWQAPLPVSEPAPVQALPC